MTVWERRRRLFIVVLICLVHRETSSGPPPIPCYAASRRCIRWRRIINNNNNNNDSGHFDTTASPRQGDFDILTTWDNQAVTHEPVHVQLSEDPLGCRLHVQAPFFDSPAAPSAPPGKPCPRLWDFEVVEAFFLNDKDQYLEVELCPHGQHLVLMLSGRRNLVQEQLALDFQCRISGSGWRGSAVVPQSYLPPAVTRFNAFAIHGEGEKRVYEALYPARKHHDKPDFHRLEYFGTIDLSSISPSLVSSKPSDLWSKY